MPFLFASCGEGEVSPASAAQAEEPQPSPSTNFSEGSLYSCGQTPFDPSRLEGPGGLEESDSELGMALRRLLATPDGAMKDSGWRVIYETKNEALVAAPDPQGENPFDTATFVRRDGDWEPYAWGGCLPKVALGDRTPVQWSLEIEPARDATELELMATERTCTGGREVTEANTRADIQYHPDAVVITISGDPLPSFGKNTGYTCIGVAPFPLTVSLEEPLNGRALIDAGFYPPSEKS